VTRNSSNAKHARETQVLDFASQVIDDEAVAPLRVQVVVDHLYRKERRKGELTAVASRNVGHQPGQRR